MDNTEKLRVLLQHWIDHNGGHVAEFAKWKEIMGKEAMAGGKQDAIVESLGKAMQQMGKVSEILKKSLDDLGGPATGAAHHHHSHDHHHHD